MTRNPNSMGSSTAGRRLAQAAVLALLCAGWLVALGAGPASATPLWNIKARWGDTNLPPGGSGQFELQVRNLGGIYDESEELVVSDELPEGVTVTKFEGIMAFLCSGEGTQEASCHVPGFFFPFLGIDPIASVNSSNGGFGLYEPAGFMFPIIFDVNVDPGASGSGENVAIASGGGGSTASDTDQIPFSATPSAFGVVPGSFEGDAFDDEWPGGSPVRQAGAHPYDLRVNFDITEESGLEETNAEERYIFPHGKGRTVKVTLPRGLIGNPEAVPKCDPVLFGAQGVSWNSTRCPADTQVGTLTLELSTGRPNNGYGFFTNSAQFLAAPIYNIEPPEGEAADFGFNVGALVQGHIYPSLDASRGYAITTTTPNVSDFVAVKGAQVDFWGVPGDPRHDPQRVYPEFGFGAQEHAATGAPFEAPIRPFLTAPMDCGEENGDSIISVDSYEDPGNFTAPMGTETPFNVEGCDDPRFRFGPKVTLQPTTRDAGTPTGLDVHLKVPQRNDLVTKASDLYAQNGDVRAIPTPPMKKVVVTLPEGMTLSPSAAQGLGSCSAAEIGIGTNDPVRCPENSRYGTLTMHTPLLPADKPMMGDIYIAKQNENPAHNFLSMYFVVNDPERGLLVKQPGRIDLDPQTGQITTTIDGIPQFPISDMQLTFKSGVRAALVNPSTCGEKKIRAEFFTWQDPETAHVVEDAYTVTQNPNGTPCIHNLAERPFHPTMQAGTVNPTAGAYSPFVFRVTRSDEDQEFSQLRTTLPPGLLANISGVTECSEAGIKQAEDPARTGTEEVLNPSCPSSSQIGSSDVGAGVGVPLTFVPGKVYLAGPYHGAPLSMVVISPALVGPYDLGVIAVRSAIQVDAAKGQATVQTDPFPQIFKGIPVRIRDIRVKIDRADTIVNPTNCEPMAVTARLTGTGGDLASTADDTGADLSTRFQASDCASLGFKPSLRFKLRGGTKRGRFPALQVDLKPRPGDANLARTTVVLPHSEFIEQGHIRTVCTRVQFAANECPPGSIYGHATAVSPLFDEPLSGPVYLRSNGGERVLPDLVVSLNGKIDVVLQGFIDSVKGDRVRSSFDVIPDAPVTSFRLSMLGGRKGLLVNSRNLCAVTSRANVKMVAQNGKVLTTRPKMGTSCKGGGRKNRRSR